MRTVLDGDVLYRARQSASGGARSVLANIDPMVCYSDGRLVIDKPYDGSVELNGRGLVLVPSVFGLPGVLVGCEEPWQPIIIYPARGSELLWEPAKPVPGALGALVGSRRASVLSSLEAPTSTTALAAQLDLPPSSISDHLSVLHNAGLVNRHRLGQVVLYRRSSIGELLVGASSTGW
jgi:DNA-binding transcriptional ArsR family regulator